MNLVKTEENKNMDDKRIVNNKEYIVKSVFLGSKELKDIILKIAERKTIQVMGMA